MKKYNTIELELRKRGIMPADLARASGLTDNTVRQVVHRKAHNRVVQDIIANILGIQPETLWGLDYDPKSRKAIREAAFNKRTKRYQVRQWVVPGDRMRKLRYERQMPLEQLSNATGIDITALSRYENGNRKMARKTVERIALGLGVDPDWIQFGDEVTKQPAPPVDSAGDRCSDPSLFPPSMGNVPPSKDGGMPENRRTQSENIPCQRAV